MSYLDLLFLSTQISPKLATIYSDGLKAQSCEPDYECVEPTSSKEVHTGAVEAAFHQIPSTMSLIWAKLRYLNGIGLQPQPCATPSARLCHLSTVPRIRALSLLHRPNWVSKPLRWRGPRDVA